MSEYNHSQKAETFQGRPIITLNWKGKKAKAVQGAFVYRATTNHSLSLFELEDALGTKIVTFTQPDDLGIGVFFTDEIIDAERIIAASEKVGHGVRWIEPVLIDRGAQIPNDTIFPQQWNLADIKAPRAWDLWHGDASTVILAVLDSGIAIQNSRLSHPDLNDAARFFPGRDLYNGDNDPADDHGHGTHVAGIAAATRNNNLGVAGLWPGAILVLKVFNASNVGSSTTFYDGVKAAVDAATENRTHLIINYSGGGPDSDTKRTAVEYARDNGALIVAAAGNVAADPIDFPAAYSTQFSNVMAVGAVDQNHLSFGSHGPEMTVVAPGVDIVSTLPNYEVTLNDEGKDQNFDVLSGTSQATPLAAGLAALIWSQWPTLTAINVRDKIIQSADALPGPFDDFGYGLINAEAALT